MFGESHVVLWQRRRNGATAESQLIFDLNLSLLHVKPCLFVTSSCWPHSGLERLFKWFPAELLLKE